MAEKDSKVPIKVSAPVAEQPVPEFDSSEVITMHSPGQTIHPASNDQPSVASASSSTDERIESQNPQPNEHNLGTEENSVSDSVDISATSPEHQEEPSAYRSDSHVVAHPHKSVSSSLLSSIVIIIVTLLILITAAAATIYFFKI